MADTSTTTTTTRLSIHPILALFVGIFAVSTASIFIRFAQESASSLVIAAYRLTLASLVLAPVATYRHNLEIKALNRSTAFLALLSGLFLAIHFASWITSLEYTTVASSVVLVTTTPLWVALLSPFLLKEPITRPVLLGLLIALAGGMLVGVSDTCGLSASGLSCPSLQQFFQGRAFLGDMLALLGAFMAAGYMMIGRQLRPRMSVVSYTFLVYGVAAIVLVAVSLATGQELFGYSSVIYGWFVALALVPQLLGHTIFNWSLRYLSATFVSLALIGEPIGSTLLAYLFLGETPTLLKLIGAVLILAGIFLASRKR